MSQIETLLFYSNFLHREHSFDCPNCKLEIFETEEKKWMRQIRTWDSSSIVKSPS